MFDYSYLITKAKEEMSLETDTSDINLSFLHVSFPYIESVDLDLLTDCNEEIPAKDVKVTGYFCNIDDNYISVYLSCFDQFSRKPHIMPVELFDKCKDNLLNLVKMVDDNSYRQINESRPIFDLCDFIVSHRNMELILNIVTNYIVPLAYNKDGIHTISNRNIGVRTYDVIDILDKVNSVSEGSQELNLIDKFGKGIPAVLISSNKDVDVFLTYFYGEWLAQLYKEDSIGLLSANVRSYLKRTNRVNKEIINTVKETPHEFVAYNNGLSLIATGAEYSAQTNSDFTVINKLNNFLIVNGGQTTATLYECKNDRLDLSKIIVPAKLSIIKNASSSEYLISNISIYSNSQTAIKKSDPPSNSKFYKSFEALSKTIWAKKNMIEYHCFFERTNGQYNTLKRMHSLKSDPFITLNPEKSKFTKLQLAQAIVSWQQHPDIVCKGQEKNFDFFNGVVKDLSSGVVDEKYFKASYALILIYRKLNQLIKKMKLPYKSNIIAYSLAFLSFKCDGYFDLLSIWEEQTISHSIETILEEIICDVYERLIDSPSNYPDIRMWSRKPECWSHIKEESKDYHLHKAIDKWDFFPENSAKIFIDSNLKNIQVWKDLENWVRNNNIQLSDSHINMIHGMPAIIYKGKISKRQEFFAKSIFLLAVESGYDYNKTY